MSVSEEITVFTGGDDLYKLVSEVNVPDRKKKEEMRSFTLKRGDLV